VEKMLKKTISPDDTARLGYDLAQQLTQMPVNLFLTGELGAGKTTFIQGLGRGLGIEDPIISPSFQLIRKYAGTGGIELVHIDLYRLKDAVEIQHLGWWEILGGDSVTAVEWADRAEGILPEEGIFIDIKHASQDMRSVEIIRK
jgi:tRNA threonylcarbamoyladenosine biosynthesis protein TsaE